MNLCLYCSCVVSLCGRPLTASEVGEKTVLCSLSRAWKLGQAVFRARALKASPVEAILKFENGKLLCTAKVSGYSIFQSNLVESIINVHDHYTAFKKIIDHNVNWIISEGHILQKKVLCIILHAKKPLISHYCNLLMKCKLLVYVGYSGLAHAPQLWKLTVRKNMVPERCVLAVLSGLYFVFL